MMLLQTLSGNQKRDLRLLAQAVLLLGGLLVYFFFDPVRAAFFPPCPFYTLTGLYCPGCGTQRALHALLHGHIQAAADLNLMALVALPFLSYSATVSIRAAVARHPVRQPLFYKPWFIKSVLVAVVVFWILRNLPFSFCRWLAP